MIELVHGDRSQLRMAFGGDTSNTAVYLARLTRHLGIAVDYVTALGDDPYSDAMVAFWQGEGVGTDLVARLAGRLPGLYIIRTDQAGERSFTYWRDQSAARLMLKDERHAVLTTQLSDAELVYLSGITLSILDEDQRMKLVATLDGVREGGGKVAFDSNFRPVGWPKPKEARHWFREVLIRTDIALPTLDDEQALWDDVDADAVAHRFHDLGVREVVVKAGASGCLVSTGCSVQTVAAVPVDPVVDSTAAGDSFNAGYLAGRLLDRSSVDSARIGHRLAGEVVRHRGAIIAEDAMPAGLLPACREKGGIAE